LHKKSLFFIHFSTSKDFKKNLSIKVSVRNGKYAEKPVKRLAQIYY